MLDLKSIALETATILHHGHTQLSPPELRTLAKDLRAGAEAASDAAIQRLADAARTLLENRVPIPDKDSDYAIRSHVKELSEALEAMSVPTAPMVLAGWVAGDSLRKLMVGDTTVIPHLWATKTYSADTALYLDPSGTLMDKGTLRDRTLGKTKLLDLAAAMATEISDECCQTLSDAGVCVHLIARVSEAANALESAILAAKGPGGCHENHQS